MTAKRSLASWFRTDTGLGSGHLNGETDLNEERQVDWLRIVPFIGLHLACLGIFLVGWSWTAIAIFAASYLVRMFAITAFYHRYFSHRSFRTSRTVQFIFALIGASATQRGPLWWAAHHRHHHKVADREADPHAPRHGFLWSHMGWFLSRRHFGTDHAQIPDLVKYPELRWLDRYDLAIPVVYAVLLFALGALLERFAPGLGTNGWQLLVWGYFVSTVVLIHVTLTINSLAHVWGKRRYATRDDSRNNAFLAVLTLGEGWHNNHHHFPGSARQGFFWWEIDLSFYVLKLMSWVGLVSDLKSVPEGIRNARRVSSA
ncbi:MAG: acyl-CoA desaturase [Wenzhouxiangella sp.]|nr:MAG: acyl-CoA desaturase [Wenzhouxiangella sp.]